MWHADALTDTEVSREVYFWVNKYLSLEDIAGKQNEDKKWEIPISVPVIAAFHSKVTWNCCGQGQQHRTEEGVKCCKTTTHA